MVATFITTYNRGRHTCREKDKVKKKGKKDRKEEKVELIENKRKEKRGRENHLVWDTTNYKTYLC